MDKKDYKLAYEYILGVLELGGDMKWPLVIDSMNIFKELVDEKLNKPTLDECIKEWEDKGYKYNEFEKKYFQVYSDRQKNKSILINLKTGEYKCIRVYYDKEEKWITPEEHNLIIKTLKALEVNNG